MRSRSADPTADLALSATPLINAVLAEHRGRLSGHNLDDIRQECFIGLLEAARRFDPSLGYQFSTYAKPWVLKYLLNWLRDGERTIRVPPDLYRKRAALRAQLDHGTDLTTAATVLGIPERRAAAALEAATVVDSLDRPIGAGDIAPDTIDPLPTPDEQVIAAHDKAALHRALARLEPDERALLIHWYGIGRVDPTGLSDLSRELGMPRHLLRERGATALAKLQHPCIRAAFGQ